MGKETARGNSPGAQDGRGLPSAHDPVALAPAAQNNVSGARIGYLIRDLQSWLRFLSSDLGAAAPDINRIGLFCYELTDAAALDGGA